MNYVYVDFGTFTGYQESENGQVTRYVDESGIELFVNPPEGLGSTLLNAEPLRLDWML